jgi:hypothetical protein
MRKEEINEFIEDSFRKLLKHFRKAINDFDLENIREFRTEIKRLKVFLHLVNIETEDGFSLHITKRMKTIYGYLGIIQNFKQLQNTNERIQNPLEIGPFCYVEVIEKELAYWKKLSKGFIDADYDFIGDKEEILALLPNKLTKESIKKFIHYTLYELNTINNRLDDVSLDNIRKFMEDIYFNYEFLKPYILDQQINLFDKEQLRACLDLFNKYRDICTALALLQSLTTGALNDEEKRIIKHIENHRLLEKKEIRNQLSAKLDFMQITNHNLNGFAFAESPKE